MLAKRPRIASGRTSDSIKPAMAATNQPTTNGDHFHINGVNGMVNGDFPNGDLPDTAQPVPAELSPEPVLENFGTERHQSHPIPPPRAHETDASGPRSRAHAKIRSYTDDPCMTRFPRISKPVELLRSSYDCIVIGSGYGGGVAASRMARTGESVCVLERGHERWPGEYPNGPKEALGQLHVSGTFAPGCSEGSTVEGGDPTGMYHLIFGKGQNAVVCNGLFPQNLRLENRRNSPICIGLGGTSLMNANVFLEADDDTLAMKMWPPEIRNNPHCLDKCE